MKGRATGCTCSCGNSQFDHPTHCAEANGPAQRLSKVAERVGLPAHGLSKHFFDNRGFDLAYPEPETGDYDAVEAVPALYTRQPGDDMPEVAMLEIVTHRTAITGRDVKAHRVSAA